MDYAIKVFGECNMFKQATATEMTDYTKRSFEESTATFEKLLTAKSVEQAIEIQSGFAKRAYDGYMHQMSKIGGMYAELAKEAYKPVEKAMQGARWARKPRRKRERASVAPRALQTRPVALARRAFFVAFAALIRCGLERASCAATLAMLWLPLE
jgi:hypothetical protein